MHKRPRALIVLTMIGTRGPWYRSGSVAAVPLVVFRLRRCEYCYCESHDNPANMKCGSLMNWY